jgi:hypothetical protein
MDRRPVLVVEDDEPTRAARASSMAIHGCTPSRRRFQPRPVLANAVL